MMRKIAGIDHIKEQIPFADAYIEQDTVMKQKSAAMSNFALAIGMELQNYSRIKNGTDRYEIVQGTLTKEEMQDLTEEY